MPWTEARRAEWTAARRARRCLAVGVAAVALSGCAGGVRRPDAPARAERDAGPGGWFVDGGIAPAAKVARADAAPASWVRAHVARRMRDDDPALHRSLARTIVDEAARARVDPLLVLAVIHVESSFEPEAESGAGAVGLMQLREPTMRGEAARWRLRSADRRDPVVNVQAGVRYLRRMLDSFGDLELALMAYNAGPGRLREHLSRGEIPGAYRAYPRKVKGELARLRLRLGAAPRLVSEAPRPAKRAG